MRMSECVDDHYRERVTEVHCVFETFGSFSSSPSLFATPYLHPSDLSHLSK